VTILKVSIIPDQWRDQWRRRLECVVQHQGGHIERLALNGIKVCESNFAIKAFEVINDLKLPLDIGEGL